MLRNLLIAAAVASFTLLVVAHAGAASLAFSSSDSTISAAPAVAPIPTNIISVTTYGAVGDGRTDDTPSIMNATAALLSLASKSPSSINILSFPSGIFLFDSSPPCFPDCPLAYIELPPQGNTNFTIVGVASSTTGGQPATTLVWSPAIDWSVPLIGCTLNDGTADVIIGSSLTLRNIIIQSTSTANPDPSWGLPLGVVQTVGIETVQVENFVYEGLQVDGLNIFLIWNDNSSLTTSAHFSDITISNAQVGISVSTFVSVVIENVIVNNTKIGVLLNSDGAVDMSTTLSHVTTINCQQAGLLLNNTTPGSFQQVNVNVTDSSFTTNQAQPSSSPPPYSILQLSSGTLAVSHSTFADTTSNITHISVLSQPGSTVMIENSRFEGGAAAMEMVNGNSGVTSAASSISLLTNTFTGPFSNSSMLVASSLDIVDNTCGPSVVNIQTKCLGTVCTIVNNQGCTIGKEVEMEEESGERIELV